MTTENAPTHTPTGRLRRRRAGVFDVRVVIALLLGIYGAVLLVVGLVGTSDADLAKADGLNINIWAGVGLLVSAAVFAGWARLRPVVVPVPAHDDE